MKIKQDVENFVYDNNNLKIYEKTDSKEFTVTNYSLITITVPKNTTDQEVNFPIGNVKIVYVKVPEVVIGIKVDAIANQQFSINNYFLINSSVDVSKLYLTNTSTETDYTINLLLGSVS